MRLLGAVPRIAFRSGASGWMMQVHSLGGYLSLGFLWGCPDRQTGDESKTALLACFAPGFRAQGWLLLLLLLGVT
jgi:hypothetical protein